MDCRAFEYIRSVPISSALRYDFRHKRLTKHCSARPEYLSRTCNRDDVFIWANLANDLADLFDSQRLAQ